MLESWETQEYYTYYGIFSPVKEMVPRLGLHRRDRKPTRIYTHAHESTTRSNKPQISRVWIILRDEKGEAASAVRMAPYRQV